MLQEIETSSFETANTVWMSSEAIAAVRDILNQRKLEGFGLRVYVSGSGCSGINYGMALDNNIQETDLTFLSEDIQLIVDDQSINYLYGAKIDFINDPVRGAGFIVDSPNNAKTGNCACGSHDHSHANNSENSGCGCGGSCGCN